VTTEIAAHEIDDPEIDVERARRDTPGVQYVTHLNNAGAALPPAQVRDGRVRDLRRWEGGAEAAERLEGTYDSVARLLGCGRDEVALVENATRAWDMAFYALGFSPGDRILTGRAEYASNVIAMLQVAARTGAVVEVVGDGPDGGIDVDDLRRRLAPAPAAGAGPVKLVAVTHVPSHGGLVNPAEEIGAAARDAGVPFLLDACQSVGQLAVDVRRIGCDMLSATGRKFLRGPRGTGFLHVRRDLLQRLEPPFLDLHAATWTAPDRYEIRVDARRFETWEADLAARIGLGVAVDYALGWGMAAIERQVGALAADLRAALQALPGVHVHDRGSRRSGIVTLTVDGMAASHVQAALAAKRINTSVSLASYAQYDLPARGLPELVRASVHYYNTHDDLERLTQAVAGIRAAG
jgi:selenocysteine lyase/cysteine desulfurase